jgi:stearoyl-CoA desaturase (delta-9 desaturase)
MNTEKLRLKDFHTHTWFSVVPLYLFFLISLTQIGDTSLTSVLLFFIFWALIGGCGIELTFHRRLSHKSFEIKEWANRLFSYLGCLAMNGSPIFWVAIHKQHHPHADTEADPHYPGQGFFMSYIGWALYKPSLDKIRFVRAGKELLSSKFQLFLQQHYYILVWGCYLAVFLISPTIFWLSFVPACLLAHNQGNIVNFFCHQKKYGYRNFEIKDNSVNIKALSFFSWGLSLHNNHHNQSQNANLAVKQGEIDYGYSLLKILSKLRIVKLS